MASEQITLAAMRDVALDFLVEKLDDSSFGVLPIVPTPWVHECFSRLSRADLNLVLREKIIPVSWIPTMTLYAVMSAEALQEARMRHLKVVARLNPSDYRVAVRRWFGRQLLSVATRRLERQQPGMSARTRLTPVQASMFMTLMGLAAAGIAYGGERQVELIFSLLAGVLFTLVVSLRVFCLLPPRHSSMQRPPPLDDSALPVYTVLVPVFQEIAVLGQLISALAAIDYPKAKLDIKLILEESDTAMHRAVHAMDLPAMFDIIIVPAGKPQTKPRALNYALQFARGSLLTIYDSEDVPDPQQLRLAAAAFAAAPNDLVCLQAALSYFNASENWLTRQFAAEYAGLFLVILPALAESNLPFLLGGTSNHFRVPPLQQVGSWDPFNVTEDADLGIRLARHGFRCGVMASETLEEANTQLWNWMKQRRRWLKGFLQTWLVHMRSPVDLHRELGGQGFWIIQCMTLGVFASALLHPILLFLAIQALMPWSVAQAAGSITAQLGAGFSLAILAGGYAAGIAVARRGLKQLGMRHTAVTLWSLPIYWLLMSVAAWLALWDFAVRPFHWHKTRHGLTRLAPWQQGEAGATQRQAQG